MEISAAIAPDSTPLVVSAFSPPVPIDVSPLSLQPEISSASLPVSVPSLPSNLKDHQAHPEMKSETLPRTKRWNKWMGPLFTEPRTTPPIPPQASATNSEAIFKKRASGDSETHFAEDLKRQKRVEAVKSLKGLICLELCAGSAKLSSALSQVGFQSIPIDHSSNKHHQRMHCVQINLAEPGAFCLIKTLLEETNIFYVHMAPPCGTASAARSRPVRPELLAAGFPHPVPLRSKEQPLGLDNLTVVQQIRVSHANQIYLLCSKVVSTCLEKQIRVSVENPTRSLFWEIPFIKAFCDHPKLECVRFHHCMLGGDRDKETQWLGTTGLFAPMGLQCDKQHSHKPWGGTMVQGRPVFDTAGESEYPAVLCATVAFLVRNAAVAAGYSLPAESMDGALTQAQLRQKLQAGTGKQPRGRKLPQLVPEFLSVDEIITKVGEPLKLDKSQSLLRHFLRAENGEKGETKDRVQVHIVGSRRTPEQFLQKAVEAGHPYKPGEGVADNIRIALHSILTTGPLGIQRKRLAAMRDIALLASSLEKQEVELHSRLPLHLQPLLAKKKILLMRTLLERSGFKDISVVDEICTGFDVVGKAKPSGLMESFLRPATTSPDQLRATSTLTRRAVLDSNRKSSDPLLDKAVYDITQQELKDRWIEGPFSEAQMHAKFPLGWIAIPRFGLRQGTKVRAIDDGKLPGLNTAFTSVEKLRLQDTDDLCALLAFLASVIRSIDENNRTFSIPLSTGETTSGILHPAWGKPKDMIIQGRTLDLSAAYKNLGNSESSLWACVLAVWSTNKSKYEMYVSNALMFGATSSVYSFNRVAKAIQHLAIHYLDILPNQFFDDFPCCELQQTSAGSQISFEAMLLALGWEVAVGEKAPPFSSAFSALGNCFDTSAAITEGVIFVSNKPSRINNIREMILDARKTKTLKPSVAAELAGKLQYSSAQVFGDVARPAVRMIRNHAESHHKGNEVNFELNFALEFVHDYLLTAPPRRVYVEERDKPILVFTDGSSEGDEHLWGAVIFGLSGSPIVAQGEIPEDLSCFWKAEVGEQIICQVELYPVLLTKLVLKKKLSSRRVIFYIDNDPSRDGLIAGASGSTSSRAMLYQFGALQRDDPSFNWFARVPSYSNYADAPSRKKGKELSLTLGASFETNWKFDRDLILKLKERC